MWIIRSIYDKLHFDDILLLEAMLTDRLRRKPSIKKKIQIKSWYRRILATETSSYEEFHCQTMHTSEENELYQAK